MKNLTLKKNCFGEIDYDSMIQEMKDKVLLLLMLMMMTHIGELKKRGVGNGSLRHIHSQKYDNSSLTPDFHSFKCVCARIAKELRGVATVDLPGLFFQIDRKGKDTMMLRLIGTVALFLVEFYSKR